MTEERITAERYDAVLFDLDGVLTKTAAVHETAWKAMFDGYLRERANREHAAFRPFTDDDYIRYVDGRPREDGVTSFLASRSIDIPLGEPGDGSGRETAWGLGNRKNELFQQVLDREGVEAYPDGVALLRGVRAAGIRTAVVSSSANTAAVLQAAGIAELFDARVDGTTVERLGLAGKPAPDEYLEAARELGVEPARAVVVEDAISGVQSGHAGGFGLVVGANRRDDGDELRANGADVAVTDLATLLPR
ncbi:MAG TPA: beta-phosphoglucomutase family hydrolase [Acidimicrobiia bacterium]